MFRRKTSEPRRSHPDPAMEQRLEGIRVKQRRVAACEALAEDYRQEISELHSQVRYIRRNYSDRTKVRDSLDQIAGLQAEIRTLGNEIDTINEALAFMMTELSSEDVAFL